jgi:hypothetical protein
MRSLFSSMKKKRKTKSNSELLEQYLHSCILSHIGYSSLFRDFLSAQRDEDRIISKVTVRQLVAHHVTHAPQQEENALLMTPPQTLKRKRSDSKCQQEQPQQSTSNAILPPSPPSSISITSLPDLLTTRSTSTTQFPEYRHDSGLTSSLYNDDDMMMCSSILGQQEEQQIYRQYQKEQQQQQNVVADNNKNTINDFQLIKVLGKGATGKVNNMTLLLFSHLIQ